VFVRVAGLIASLIALAAVAVSGCGSGGGAAPDAAGADSALYSCEMEPRAMTYTPGMAAKQSDGTFAAELMTTQPGQIPVKGSNDWTVEILDAAGNPADGLTVAVTSKMPDHNHPTTVQAVVTPAGGGMYSLSPVYLYMPGYWEVTLDVTDMSGTTGKLVFPICISG
jgi:hypothetical protein